MDIPKIKLSYKRYFVNAVKVMQVHPKLSKLRKRELELVSLVLWKYALYKDTGLKEEDIRVLLDSTKTRKEIGQEMDITPANFNNILKGIVKKDVLNNFIPCDFLKGFIPNSDNQRLSWNFIINDYKSKGKDPSES